MGIFNKLFGGTHETEENSKLPWVNLVDKEQLNLLEEASNNKLQIIFKHSTRCGISSMVKRQFEKEFPININVDLYYLDLLKYRDISNQITTKFNIQHESPQLLIVKGGEVIKHASHGQINDLDLKTFV
ncbi:bacillithiol system redox-active protein YtxJ [Mangrovimonas spongiae]|uniref:Bacillithiol system redox-active protein YtxJ n=1 Tax=Mangrovimonas spongiae TaxID=2494697 RepID=A0A3R9ME55_9FLAO|nr:bacillithiol system redox-active protein YtxJ [Mangrovimonas spongiae]RSK38262.1 bacillithiol system redox-active protein YtxJ [Mangrovimonas spongiae]